MTQKQRWTISFDLIIEHEENYTRAACQYPGISYIAIMNTTNSAGQVFYSDLLLEDSCYKKSLTGSTRGQKAGW